MGKAFYNLSSRKEQRLLFNLKSIDFFFFFIDNQEPDFNSNRKTLSSHPFLTYSIRVYVNS